MDTIVSTWPIIIGLVLSVLVIVTVLALGSRRGDRLYGPWKLYSNPLDTATAILITLAFILDQCQGFALLEPPYTAGSILTRFFDSIHDTFQTVSLDGSPRIGAENLLAVGWRPFFCWAYLVYQSLIYVLAPATAFSSAAFLLFTVLSSPVLWWRSRKRDTYVFSEANSSSLTLAQSILAHGQKKGTAPLIAFAEVDHADEALVDEARAMGVVCSDKSITELTTKCSANTERFFIFSSDNEAKNLRDALKLTKMFADMEERPEKQPTVIVFSNSALSDGYVDSAVAMCEGTAKFRRFDHIQNTINQVLMEMPVFLNVAPQQDDSELDRRALYAASQRRILIVGAGNMGTAFLKGALWSGQSNEVQMHIDVIDVRAEDAQRRLALECPEISGMLGTRDPDDPHDEAYDVEYHAYDVFSGEFETLMREHGGEVTYAFVALGDDLLTAQAARRLRELLERSRVNGGEASAALPPIVAVIDDTLVAASVEDAASPKGQPYHITTVGSTESLFSYENVFHPKLERWAMNLNAAYWGCFDASEDERKKMMSGANSSFDAVEYNRVSSRSSAVFLKRHLFEFCRAVESGKAPAADMAKGLQLPSVHDWTLPLDNPAFSAALEAYDAFINASDSSREPFQELEHRRWNAFMRTLGYERCSEKALETINASLPEGSKRQNCDHLSKLHICLVPFNQLDEVNKMFERISNKNPLYQLSDDVIIRHLRDIVLYRP